MSKNNRREIILASASPRRQELLRLMGYDFRVVISSFDETSVTPWPPDKHVLESSAGKAEDAALYTYDAIIIGADTVVVIDDRILGKPSDPDDARRMLNLLSGRSHYVYTGLCVILQQDGQKIRRLTDYVQTEVHFGELSDEIIEMYIATGEPMDKAGAYGIQEKGCVLVERIVGDYFNVVGLPVYCLSRILMEMGVPPFGGDSN